jgi:hypothetical protein
MKNHGKKEESKRVGVHGQVTCAHYLRTTTDLSHRGTTGDLKKTWIKIVCFFCEENEQRREYRNSLAAVNSRSCAGASVLGWRPCPWDDPTHFCSLFHLPLHTSDAWRDRRCRRCSLKFFPSSRPMSGHSWSWWCAYGDKNLVRGENACKKYKCHMHRSVSRQEKKLDGG